MGCRNLWLVFTILLSRILSGSGVSSCCFPGNQNSVKLYLVLIKLIRDDDRNTCILGFFLLTRGSHLISRGQPVVLSCQIKELDCHTLNTFGCNLNINWIVRVKSDNYIGHSLLYDNDTEEIVQNIKYDPIATTNKSDLSCGSNVPQNFSVTFTDIGPYEEVLVSCGLTMNHGFDVDSNVAVLRQCKLYLSCIITVDL